MSTTTTNTTQGASPKKFEGAYVFESKKIYHLTAGELYRHMLKASEFVHRSIAEGILNSYPTDKIAIFEYIAEIGKK